MRPTATFPSAAGCTEGVRARLPAAIGIILIAFNLRPVFSSVAPVLPEVVAGLGISPAGASLLTTAPVLCLGLFAPVAPALAARFGFERLLLGLLAALTVGSALRAAASVPVLFVGVIVAGTAIAMLNVTVTGLVKRDFADRAALMTGSYSLALCAGAALAAGTTAPLMHALGSWSWALAFWAVPAFVAALAWAIIVQPRAATTVAPATSSFGALWRDPLAWQVTFCFGLQSGLAYCVFGWLAPILRERGLDPTTAGLVASVSILMQAPASFVAPWFATRGRDQRLVAATLFIPATAGLLGAIAAPLSTVWIWAILQGIGQGGLFSVAMILFLKRSPDAATAARLAGMAQGVGYLMAGTAPFVVGLIRSRTGGFDGAMPLILAIGVAGIAAALGAGRNRLVAGS